MNLKEYIEAILPLIKAARKHKRSESHAARHVHYLYGQSFYGFDEYAKKKASKNAKALYASRGFQDKLSEQSIHNQKSFDPKGRKLGDFHLEHVFTGTAFRDEITKLSDEELTVEKIEKIVTEKFIRAWILKREDKALNKAGFKSLRPENPEEAYKKVGIDLER